MKSNWDFYLCEVENRPASILVDIGAADSVPDSRYSRMGYVSVPFACADENGFPLSHDHETLAHLEDALVTTLVSEAQCVYVGRCILDGRMDCIFYAAADFPWEDSIEAALEDFSGFDWETGIHDEPGWDTYLEFLYPDPANMLEIQNRRALRRLEDLGDDLESPRAIEHWLSFASAEGRECFWREVEVMSFLRDTGAEEKRDEEGFRICLRREDAPADVDDISLDLLALASEHGGTYDGWSCATPELVEDE
jgi:uncharacterized protein (TIGR01619 family)